MFTLSKINESGTLVSKCLSTASETLIGCKTYEKISDTYECFECDSEYSKETVMINSNSKFRCLLQISEVVEDCTSYIVRTSNTYLCSQCSLGYTL